MNHNQSSLFMGARDLQYQGNNHNNRPYIHDGRVLRRHRGRGGRGGTDYGVDYDGDYNLTIRQQLKMIGRHFSFRKFWTVVIFLLLVVLTNPANQLLPPTVMESINQLKLPSQPSPSTSSTSSLLDKASRWLIPSSGITNYGLFALEDRFDGVTLQAFGQESLWFCPYSSYELGPWCEFVADNFCHHKPLLFNHYYSISGNKNRNTSSNNNGSRNINNILTSSSAAAGVGDMAYTTHRLLCLLLMLSSLLDYCCGPWAPPLRVFWKYPTLDAITGTVFYRPNLIHDLFYQNLAVYPALVEMQTIITTRLSSSPTNKFISYRFPMVGTSIELNYILFVVLLVVGVGGGANAIAARIGRQDPFTIRGGYSSVIAASLGYCMYETVYRNTFWFSTKNKVLLSAFGIDYTAVRAFWSSAAMIILNGQQQASYAASSRQWFPQLVAWLVAGFGGLLLAKYPLQ